MKDSKEYSGKVHKLCRSLKRRYPKVEKVAYEEPVDSLVYAIVSEHISEAAAESAIKKFADYFVDLNDLRVSRAEEVVELLGGDTSVTRHIAVPLAKALSAVFTKYHAVSLKALKKTGKRPARKTLEKMDGVSRFAVNYCMLTSLQAHAVPLNQKMIDYLRSEHLVHPEAAEEEIEGFLTRLVPAEEAYQFYSLLRRQCESRRAGRKKAKSTKSKIRTRYKKSKK
jgi:endonuclease III